MEKTLLISIIVLLIIMSCILTINTSTPSNNNIQINFLEDYKDSLDKDYEDSLDIVSKSIKSRISELEKFDPLDSTFFNTLIF